MKNKKTYESFDNSFYRLANEIAKELEIHRTESTQKEQVEELMDAERKFKKTILTYRQSTEIYKKFLQKVCITNRNILSARPYFREKSTTFSKHITPAIKSENIEELKKFDINFQMIKFIKDNWLGPFPKRAELLFNRVHKARETLIICNLPLSINRAKLFYRKTPKSHMNLLDMISVCAMGLAAGIDKYCGSYTPVFRGVCIGRMVGNLIDSYSETTLHFFPSDKRILYKAHSIRGRQGIEDVEELCKAVNESFKQDQKEGKTVPTTNVDVGTLSALLNAASTVSADSTVNEEGYGVYQFTADHRQDIESAMIEQESTKNMLQCAQKLSILHKKVLQLKGIKL